MKKGKKTPPKIKVFKPSAKDLKEFEQSYRLYRAKRDELRQFKQKKNLLLSGLIQEGLKKSKDLEKAIDASLEKVNKEMTRLNKEFFKSYRQKQKRIHSMNRDFWWFPCLPGTDCDSLEMAKVHPDNYPVEVLWGGHTICTLASLIYAETHELIPSKFYHRDDWNYGLGDTIHGFANFTGYTIEGTDVDVAISNTSTFQPDPDPAISRLIASGELSFTGYVGVTDASDEGRLSIWSQVALTQYRTDKAIDEINPSVDACYRIYPSCCFDLDFSFQDNVCRINLQEIELDAEVSDLDVNRDKFFLSQYIQIESPCTASFVVYMPRPHIKIISDRCD